MTSSYSTDLKIELMVTGENAGTWGDKTNDNLDVIEQAIAGFKQVSIAGGAQTTNLLINNSPDIATSDARNAVIKLSGTITGNQIVTVPTGITKTYIVQNGTTGAFTVQFIQAGGTGTTFSTTDKGIKILFADGTNINAVDLSTLSGTIATAQIADLAITSSKLASFAVTSARLASFAVTSAKLATNAVTAIKITQSTITQSKLASNSVGSDQLISTGVTAASYTAASITVDADGRITAASSGSAAVRTGYEIKLAVNGPSTGTYTASPGVTRIVAFMAGGGGGGNCSCFMGGVGGSGIFYKTITQPFSQPYAVGGGGGTNASGGATSITNVGVSNGGAGPPGNSATGASPGADFAFNGGSQTVAYTNKQIREAFFSPGTRNLGPGDGGSLYVYENVNT